MRLHITLGRAYSSKENWTEALRSYDQGLHIAEALSDNSLQTELFLLFGKSLMYIHDKDYNESKLYLEKALEQTRKHGNWEQAINLLHELGTYYRGKGHADEAIKCYTNAKAIIDNNGAKQYLARNQSDLGNCYELKGDFKNAEKCHLLAIETSKVYTDRQGQSVNLYRMAHLHMLSESWETALKYCRRIY